jgi:prepilin-type processing-associated H-X9-DG protein
VDDGQLISGVFARFEWAARFGDITDGLSNTIAMGEVRGNCTYALRSQSWANTFGLGFATTAPINYPTCPGEDGVPPGFKTGFGCAASDNYNTDRGFKSRHQGGAFFLLCDGSVQFLQQSIYHPTYQALGDRRDGTPIQE